MKKEYLSEEKYEKIKKVLIKIGLISIIIAVVLLITSFVIKVPELGEEGWSDAQTTVGIMRFGAFVFGVFLPFPIFGVAFGREITAFNAQQSMPIAQEGIEKMAPSMGTAAKEIAKGIKDGLSDDNTIYCKHCGSLIDNDSRFCKSCGKEQ